MAGLQDILKSGGGAGMPPQGGQPPMGGPDMGGAPQSPLAGNPLAAAGAIGTGGLQKLAAAIVAAIIRVLDFILPIFGTNSKEGNKILSAIRGLQEVAGDAKATDVMAAIQTLVSSLPANMQGANPLSGITGILQGGGQGQPQGGQPQPPMGGTPGMPPQGGDIQSLMQSQGGM
jgi:hypothetical protein